MSTLSLECTQASCPLLIDGTCLDGFPEPNDCPNTDEQVAEITLDAYTDSDDSSGPDVEDGVRLDSEHTAAPQPERINPTSYIGGDQALSMSEAGLITASRPSTVILVAGDYGSGKTTLVVELWAQFLSRSFHGWHFAGSRTLPALDRRHSSARLSSGRTQATTERTRDDDMRLLHLELASDAGIRKSLLFSDVKGEFFGDLIHGQSVTNAVPLAERADLCVLVIDGGRLADPADRAESVWRSRLLLGALSEPGGLRTGTKILILISKSDLLPVSVRSEVEQSVNGLRVFATGRTLSAETVFVSARPEAAQEDPQGLEAVVDWVSSETSSPPPEDTSTAVNEGRFFWRSSTR